MSQKKLTDLMNLTDLTDVCPTMIISVTPKAGRSKRKKVNQENYI